MDYIIENLWPIPVYAAMVSDIPNIQLEIDSVYPNLKFEDRPDEPWGKTHKTTDKNFSQNLINDNNMVLLKTEILKHVQNYCNEIGFNYHNNILMESWMTSFSKGEFAKVHNHGLSDIAGVYYYKTSGVDGDFFFEPAIPYYKFTQCYNKKYNQAWTHRPMVGKILIFPGWLDHGVRPNETDQLRHSISFNIMFRR